MKPKIFLKKLLCLVLVLLLVVSLAGCGSSGTEVSPDSVPTVAEVPTSPDDGADSTEAPEPTAASPPEETAAPESMPTEEPVQEPEEHMLPKDGAYTSAEDVALYIHQYGKLPGNFITKKEAQKLGWSGGGLDKYAPGKSIGGDRFGNYEKLLPEKEGRTYTECDIDTMGAKSRGAKRIVFSNDGLIYYTGDHYESFTLMYGEENL